MKAKQPMNRGQQEIAGVEDYLLKGGKGRIPARCPSGPDGAECRGSFTGKNQGPKQTQTYPVAGTRAL